MKQLTKWNSMVIEWKFKKHRQSGLRGIIDKV